MSNLLTQLRNHRPVDVRESDSLKRIIEFVERAGDASYDRNADAHHLTGSAFVSSPCGLLLHFHKKIPLWMQPGGHLDEGETPRDAAIREVFEETGIKAVYEEEIFHVDVHDTPAGHTHYDIRYFATTENTALSPPADESQKVAWFALPALSFFDDPALVGAISRFRAKWSQ
jgi:ADP-ribose pyrophosphatase YjhB (NUDIX family)